MTIAVGILGVGIHLPKTLRTNDWWPKTTVDAWRAHAAKTEPLRLMAAAAAQTEGEKRVHAAMAAIASDPFSGARQRHVVDTNTTSCELGARAAESLFADTNARREDIDCLLVYNLVPDHLGTNNACTLHEMLGLPRRCFTMNIEAACNSFLMQLCIAEDMIQAGRVKHALLIQSCTPSRVLAYDEPVSAMLGDGATAVLVGPVANGRGILGRAHRTDGSLPNTLVGGNPGHNWYEAVPTIIYSANPKGAHRMFETVADWGLEAANEALADAGLANTDVTFYASHQGTAWFTEVTQPHFGLSHARSLETYSLAGNLSAASIPFVLATARERALLHDEDVVLMYAGGSGIAWSSVVLRWSGA